SMLTANMHLYASYASSFLFALLCVLISTCIRHLRRTMQARRLTTYEDIRALLDPPLSLTEQLCSRAIPNARLKRAFQIYSTFVRGDIAAHSSFTRDAARFISARNIPWARFADVANDAVALYLPRSADTIMFDTFISRVTIHVVLVGILGADSEHVGIDPLDVDVVTSGINDLWVKSKASAPLPPNLLEDVNSRLRRWLPALANPLEFVIPAYETIWRVVATAVALNHDNEETRNSFLLFLQEPDADQFRRFTGESASVEATIQEVLRLYPPTRRISRAVTIYPFPFLPYLISKYLSREIIVAADIEALQRSAVWGHLAMQYDPLRHHPQRCNDAQRQTLLAFGAGKLTCVAKNWAPQAAALIVAAVFDRVGVDKAFKIEAGREILGGREGWEGWIVKRID
ncbi:uncharacterized protein LAESUDRAFT_642033, partial [Laetiporus sulphureus 93-53]